MNEKELFIEELKKITKKIAIDVISFCKTLVSSKASSVITYQLIKAATSTGANYRAACRARSKSDFTARYVSLLKKPMNQDTGLKSLMKQIFQTIKKDY